MKNNTLYALGLIMVAVVWGTNFGISRLAMETFPPILFTFIRFGGAVPIFFLILKWKEGTIGIDRKSMLQLAVIGLVGITGVEILVNYSIRFTTLANASLLNVAPWPIFAALFAPLFTTERITRRIVTGGGLALVGVALVILGGEEGLDLSGEHMIGNLMAFSISILGALYNLASMPLMARYSALRVITWMVLFGSLYMLPFTWSSWGQVDWGAISGTTWVAAVYSVVMTTVVCFLVWNACMYRVGATRANFFRYVVPVVAVIAGYIMYDESIMLLQMGGALLMAAGLVWIQLERPANEASGGKAA